jgi:hypothetical protein
MIVTLGATLSMLAGLVTASPALAGRGHKWELLQARPFTAPASAYCPFDVGVTFPVSKEYAKLLKASDGATLMLTTGSLQVTYTNLSTGKAITENVSGPGKTTTYPDGSITLRDTGRSGTFFTPRQAKRFGLPVIGVTAGTSTESISANGRFTSASLHGHVLVDVCAALS